jgi:hypothetical protein
MLVVGLSVLIAQADDKPIPPPKRNMVPLEEDWRLAKKPGAQPRKIGVLSCYPNNGGGYTFREWKCIAFYSLPYLPTTYKPLSNGTPKSICGTREMPFGGQTVYRSHMEVHIRPDRGPAPLFRVDMPIAEWSRDTLDGRFRLSIACDDYETRLKLKSIVPVLEHAEHAR